VNDLVLTFTTLFPSAAKPQHGLFVQDRMQRVVQAGGFDWRVVAPVPRVPFGLRRGEHRLHAVMPARENVAGVEVAHPRYLHVPGLSLRQQALRMARGAMAAVQQLAAGRRVLLDAHYVYPDGIAALHVANAFDLPCVVTARGTDLNVIGRREVVARQIRALAPRARALFAVSEDLVRAFTEIAGLPPGRVQLARNGVDPDRFPLGDRARARQLLGLPARPPLLLGAGRLVRSKGFHLAVQALGRLPGVGLVLAGDGEEREALRAQGGDDVHLLGSLPPDGMALAYQAADVLVLPSAREGWPNVVTEALAAGLPVVAHAVGAVPQILTDPCFGAAVPPGDEAALVAAVRRFLALPPPRAEVRAFARRFAWSETVTLLVDRFRAILAEARR
jgi:glycosyltransferase involved in cell wall biosynthesis